MSKKLFFVLGIITLVNLYVTSAFAKGCMNNGDGIAVCCSGSSHPEISDQGIVVCVDYGNKCMNNANGILVCCPKGQEPFLSGRGVVICN